VRERELVRKIDVDYVSELARVELTADERRRFQAQLDQIVGYMQVLEEAPTQGVEPSPYPGTMHNVWRSDTAQPSRMRAEAAANAPRWRNSLFVVPPIMDQT